MEHAAAIARTDDDSSALAEREERLPVVIVPRHVWEKIFADLDEIKSRIAAGSSPNDPLTPAQFGKRINRSERTVLRWIESGKLKARREGRTVLIPASQVASFAERGKAA